MSDAFIRSADSDSLTARSLGESTRRKDGIRKYFGLPKYDTTDRRIMWSILDSLMRIEKKLSEERDQTP